MVRRITQTQLCRENCIWDIFRLEDFKSLDEGNLLIHWMLLAKKKLQSFADNFLLKTAGLIIKQQSKTMFKKTAGTS